MSKLSCNLCLVVVVFSCILCSVQVVFRASDVFHDPQDAFENNK